MEKVTRTYNITKELSGKLREASFYLKKPQSEIVRDALELYLKKMDAKIRELQNL